MRKHAVVLLMIVIASIALLPEAPRTALAVGEPKSDLRNTSYANRTEIADFIADHQEAGGGFRLPGSPPYLNYTALSLLALKSLGMEGKADVQSAIDFISDCQNPDGGFSAQRYYQDYDPSDLYLTWLAVWATSEYGALNRINYAAARRFVISLQLPDGSWGNTFLTAIALDVLRMTGGIAEIDTDALMSYLTSEPPRGVFYAGIGFLSTPSSAYPDVISTWAGAYALALMGKSDLIPAGIIDFLSEAQDPSGGFAYAPNLSPNIEATYYAMRLLKEEDLIRGGSISVYGAVVFALYTATYSSSLFAVDVAAMILGMMSTVMIPQSFSVNATNMVAVQGDLLEVNISLVNTFLEPIKGASMTLEITESNYVALMVEVKDGLYRGFIDTSSLKNGTYTIRISGSKQGYEKFEFERHISVFSYIYLSQLSIEPSRGVHVGDKVRVLVHLVDRAGRSVRSANVRVRLADRIVSLNETAPGIYIGEIEAGVPGDLNLIITASAEGFADFEYSVPLRVSPPPRTSNLGENYILELLVIALMWVMGVIPKSARRESSVIFGSITASSLAVILSKSYIISVAPSPTDMVTSYILSPEFRISVGLTIGLTLLYFMRKRLFNLRQHYYLISMYGVNIISISSFVTNRVTTILVVVLAITAMAAYLKGGGIPENHIYRFFMYVSAWLTLLMGWAVFGHYVDNPYFLGNILSPPSALAMNSSVSVWISFGYVMVLVSGFLGILKTYVEEILSGMRVSVVKAASQLNLRGE